MPPLYGPALKFLEIREEIDHANAMIDFTCSSCQKKLRVRDESSGKNVKCPGCGSSVSVPLLAVARMPPVAPPTPQSTPTDSSELGTLSGSDKRSEQATLNRPEATIDAVPRDDVAATSEHRIDFLAPAQTPEEIGRLGSYRVLKVLGQGGMGMVFLAEDLQLHRKVALKTMLPEVATISNAKERFLREARAVAAIEHEHIIAIHQVGEDRGVPFLAMPLLKGQALDACLKERSPLAVDEALRIGREIAEGLAAAHGQGLVHRDIKPGNIWLEGDRKKVKILDFGLARGTGESAQLTQLGAIVGTPAYMAPEQARGESVDARADLFSLGCILYELLTGRRPFPGNNAMAILTSLANHTPKPPSEINSEVSLAVSDIVMKLLAKNPGNRYSAAATVAQAIRQAEADPRKISIAASSGDFAKGEPASQSRRRWPWILIVLFALLPIGWIAAQYVLRAETEHGTLVIDVDDPSIEIRVKQSGVIVADKSTNREFQLQPGPGVVEAFERNGVDPVTTKAFAIIKNGKETIRIGMDAIKNPRTRHALRFEGQDSHVVFPTLICEDNVPSTMEGWLLNEPLETRLALKTPTRVRQIHRIGNDFRVMRIEDKSGRGEQFAIVGKPGEWSHFAAVHDGTATSFYTDGKRIPATRPVNAILPRSEAWPTFVGHFGRQPKSIATFGGTIAGLRFSKSARYRDDFTPPRRFENDVDTMALYRFDEGQGDQLKDSSGNGHHGVIVRANWTPLPDASPATDKVE